MGFMLSTLVGCVESAESMSSRRLAGASRGFFNDTHCSYRQFEVEHQALKSLLELLASTWTDNDTDANKIASELFCGMCRAKNSGSRAPAVRFKFCTSKQRQVFILFLAAKFVRNDKWIVAMYHQDHTDPGLVLQEGQLPTNMLENFGRLPFQAVTLTDRPTQHHASVVTTHRVPSSSIPANSSAMRDRNLDSQYGAKTQPHHTSDVPRVGQDVKTQHHTPLAAVQQISPPPAYPHVTTQGVLPSSIPAKCSKDVMTQYQTPSAAEQQISQPASSLTCSVRQAEVVDEKGIRGFFRLVLPLCIPAEILSEAYLEDYVNAVLNSPSETKFQVEVKIPNAGTEPNIVGMMSSEYGINNCWYIKFAYLQGFRCGTTAITKQLKYQLDMTQQQPALDW